ncbi:protein arginine N-methyltransferase 7 [Neocloeon triangulifer]|uniref:protein arginine N-methyltransferase 7 n=1 Tax=Neocloeon triangulifer TaxID=2078957 RepID=UPI00286F4518|nr:protein arginine N-methyltransferase 7 [Neocloeon triangulifer]
MAPVKSDSLSDSDIEEEYFDWHQNIARAGFADMLFDTSRNELYKEGLQAAIRLKHEQGKKANVLDIGTGTGLLSMLAVECGADSVVACEAFEPMAECAAKVIKLNRMQNKIKIIKKHSTKLKVGVDLEQRANILVTEVFDTDLIGEGAIETFRHANTNLLEPDSFVVPHLATIHVQLVSGKIFNSWMRIDPDKDLGLQVPKEMSECAFSNSHDMQISSLLPTEDFKALSEPIPVLDFDLTSPSLALKRLQEVEVEATQDGFCPGVFFWWDCKMDPKSEVTMSCAPHWAGNPEWRDHWMQSFFFFPQEIEVKKGEQVKLTSCHDEFNFWFFTDKNSTKSTSGPPPCTCDLHRQLSLTRLGQINDPSRRSQLKMALSEILKSASPDKQILYLGDDSLLPILASKISGRTVTCEGDGRWSQKIAEVSEGDVTWAKNVQVPGVVLLEPYYTEALLPWQNLKFLPRLRKLECDKVMPMAASIWAMPVQFTHLWKIRAPLGTCMGFQMQPFDELVMKSIVLCDEQVEPQPLWEYDTICLGIPKKILNLDFLDSSSLFENSDSGSFEKEGVCHGFALWMDWHLTAELTVSTGPTEPPKVGEKVKWDKFTRQGVYFSDERHEVTSEDFYRFSATHEVESCKTDFSFGIFLHL